MERKDGKNGKECSCGKKVRMESIGNTDDGL